MTRKKKYNGIHPTLKATPHGPFARNERLRWNIVGMVRWLQDAFPPWATHDGRKWLSTEIEKHGGEESLAAAFAREIRATTHNERSAAATSYKKTFLSKFCSDAMLCGKVLKGETNM